MSTKEQRVLWEREMRLARWWALTLGGLALVGIVLLSLFWQLDTQSAIVELLLGALGCQLLLQAIEAAQERLQLADPPGILRARGSMGITLALLLVLALSFVGFIQIPDLMRPLVLGSFGLVSVYAVQWVREQARPRNFVTVVNEGNVLTLQRGTLLLTALEDAGYRLITQCGRQGACASCRVRVREGTQNWLEKHYGPAITPRQKREGWVLACQVPVESDLAIELFKPVVIRWPAPDRSRLSGSARAIRAALPGFDCEACGYSTCDQYAQAIAQGKASLTRCLPGGAAVSKALRETGSELHLKQVRDHV